MKLGASTASFYPLEPNTALEQIGRWGVPNVEIFINTYSEMEIPYIKQLKEIVDNYNINVISLHPFTSGTEPFMFFTDYQKRFYDGLEQYKRFFEAMNILEAEIFVFHGDDKLNPIDNNIVYERYYKLYQLGKEFGVTVAHENVDRCKGHDINFFLEMKKQLKDDMKLVFDNKQAIRGGVDYKEFIEKLGENIVHVHLSDNISQSENCLPLGRGTADISDLLTRLKEKNFDNTVVIELYNKFLTSNEEINESYQKLFKIVDNLK